MKKWTIRVNIGIRKNESLGVRRADFRSFGNFGSLFCDLAGVVTCEENFWRLSRRGRKHRTEIRHACGVGRGAASSVMREEDQCGGLCAS